MESPVYHVKGWGKFNRHYGDFCIGADKNRIGIESTRIAPASNVGTTKFPIGDNEAMAKKKVAERHDIFFARN
jgi:hypothetical protein